MIALGIWISMALASYLLYPMLMRWLASGKRLPYVGYASGTQLPEVSVFIPLHNEELVIERKLRSVLASNYPAELLKIYCGLDDCTDGSKDIVIKMQGEFPDRLFFVETERLGKPEMLNKLAETFPPAGKILILTDANVIFLQDTVMELVRYFKDAEIGLVDAVFVLNVEVVSHEMEFEYLGMEQQLKYAEGLKWGTTQGPFGGCYAIRGELYEKIPKDFLVDDFFIGMSVMQKGYKAIVNPSARVMEEVHTGWEEEYRRKMRISAGNFQNLSRFAGVLSKPFTPLAFSFFFHKILRWILPVLAVPVAFISLLEIVLWDFSPWPLLITLTLILLPVPLHCILHKLNLPVGTIRRLSYFTYINIALLHGFITYLKGIQSNVWKPTKRN